MKLTSIFIHVFLIGFVSVSFAQNVEFKKTNFPDDQSGFKKALKAKREGDHFFEIGDMLTALSEYLKVQELTPDNAENNYKVGVCYLQSIYKVKSVDYLEHAYELDSLVAEDIFFQLGSSHHLSEDWDLAIEWYSKFLAKVQLEKDSKIKSDKIKIIEKRIKECGYGKEFVANPVKVELVNVGDQINTPFPEYFVIINADESVMMFTSQRPGSTGETAQEEGLEYAFHFEDVYVSKRDGDQEDWGTAEGVGKPVNTRKNDATIALAPDGHTVLTYNDHDPSQGGDIYQCDLDGDNWTEPKRLSDNVNSQYHECSASFSYDAHQLFFVSNKPEDNLGGHDIFVSLWNDTLNDWMPSANIGDHINTEYNEQGVFAHPDGVTLYFSSEGHNSMGGFDIFKTKFKDGKWSAPENLGYPINGPDNDVGLKISASGKHGFLSAYHNDSYGKDDIYQINFIEDVEEHLTILKGHVKDEKTKLPLAAKIEITDLGRHVKIATFSSNASTGHYLVSLPAGHNYAIEIDAPDHLFHSENFNIPATDDYHEVVKDIYLKEIKVGSKEILKNVFFDTDKSTLRPESRDELDKVADFMKLNSTIKVEFSGHTDDRGSDTHNEKLSDDRAIAVVEYLVNHGVERERMVPKGYGETKPIATNETEEGRQLNRRTEMEIIGR